VIALSSKPFARLLVLLSLAMTLAAGPLAAQAPGEIPFVVTTDQNAIMRQFAPPLTRPRSVDLKVTGEIAGIPPELQVETRFQLKSVEIEGVMAFDPSVFTPLWQRLIDKEVSLIDIKGVLEGIQNTYRRNDFRATAIMPPQNFAGGHIKIVIYEYYIKDLVVKGNGVKRLGAKLDVVLDRIAKMRPIRVSQVNRYLLLIQDQAGVSVTGDAINNFNGEPGAVHVELTFTFNPGNLTLGTDNYGGQNIGPLQSSANAHVNDMFGLFESSDLLVVTNPAAPDQLAFVNWAQLVPLDTTGFSVNYFVGQSWSSPGGLQRQIQLNSQVLNAGVGLNYALVRLPERNLFLNAGVFLNNSSIDVLQQQVTRDRTRWLSFGAKYDDDLFGVKFILNPAFVKGVNAFGQNLVNYDFSALTLNGALSANITDTLAVKVAFNGQYALTPLPAALVSAYGGLLYGRAYDPGAIAGNSTIIVAGEIAQAIETHVPWLTGLSLFVYGDYGAAWNPPGIAYPYASLASVGFGLRANIAERLAVSALVAQPLWYDPDLAALGVEQQTRYRFTVALRF
jgi:hemolysin activation/secretion protein